MPNFTSQKQNSQTSTRPTSTKPSSNILSATVVSAALKRINKYHSPLVGSYTESWSDTATRIRIIIIRVTGEFVGIKNEEALRNLPSLEYISIKAEQGKFIGKSSDGYKMATVVILHNSDVEQFNKDLEFVNNEVYVETKQV